MTSIDQSSSAVQLTIERTGGSNGDASVHYQTNSGAAVAGVDFSTNSGDLTWANGDATNKVINVALRHGTTVSTPKSFSVSLSGAAGASLGNRTTEEVIINPSSQIEMSATSYTATQGGGHVNVEAKRTGNTSGAVDAHFGTSNGTAVAGTQYTPIVSTLSWAAGDATAHTVSIPVMSTPTFSGTKDFKVALAAPTGATLGSATTATVNIQGSSGGTGGTTPPTSGLYVYQNHSGTGPYGTSSLWHGDFSFGSNGPIVGTDTTHPEPGHTYDLKIPGGRNGVGGGMAWMPVASYGDGIPDGSRKGPFGFDMSPYTWMTFDIWTAFPNDIYDMLFEYLGNFPAGTADQGTGAYIDNVGKLPGVVLASSGWTTVKLPVAALGQLGVKGVYKFYLRDNTGGASQDFYLDNVGFIPGSHSFIYDGGAPNGFDSLTNTWTNNPSTLLNGWVDASTAAVNYGVAPITLALLNKVSLNGMTKPGIGTTSTNCISMISTTVGGMWKVNNPGFALSSYTHFTFGALPTSGTHSYSVQFYDTSGAAIGSAVSVLQNSTFTTREWNQNGGHWTIYSIPLSAFGALPAQIGGMSIKDTSGLAANIIYLSAPAFFN
jgi:hypothetical protein